MTSKHINLSKFAPFIKYAKPNIKEPMTSKHINLSKFAPFIKYAKPNIKKPITSKYINLSNSFSHTFFIKYAKPNIIKEPMLNSLYKNPPILSKPNYISLHDSKKTILFEGNIKLHYNQNKKIVINAVNSNLENNEVIEISQSDLPNQPKKTFSNDTINTKDLTKLIFQNPNSSENVELILTIYSKYKSINFTMLDQNNLSKFLLDNYVCNKKIILDKTKKVIQIELSDLFYLFLITEKQNNKIIVTNIKIMKSNQSDVDNFCYKYLFINKY